jgi:hypothetical protein
MSAGIPDDRVSEEYRRLAERGAMLAREVQRLVDAVDGTAWTAKADRPKRLPGDRSHGIASSEAVGIGLRVKAAIDGWRRAKREMPGAYAAAQAKRLWDRLTRVEGRH